MENAMWKRKVQRAKLWAMLQEGYKKKSPRQICLSIEDKKLNKCLNKNEWKKEKKSAHD